MKKKILKQCGVIMEAIFAEYMFIKNFKNDPKISKKITLKIKNT